MTMLFKMFILLFICVPINTVFNSTLRLYNSFGEFHQAYTGPVRFLQTDWDNINHESFMLRSSTENNKNEMMMFERRIVRITMNTTGTKVFVRRYPEHKYPILCELINNDNSYTLVREIETGHYFRVQSNLVEYFDNPQLEPVYEVSFYPLPLNHSFTISYIIKNLQWKTRYILHTLSDNQTKFQILIDLINTSPSTYYFNQIDLFSGNINLIFPTSSPTSSSMDHNDIYLFSSINNFLTLHPYSTLTLPISSLSIHIQIVYVYTLVLKMSSLIALNNIVSFNRNKHKFQRLYQLSNSSSILPNGHLFLYDSFDKILIGEWYLPRITRLETYEFQLGDDSDVLLIYNLTTTHNAKINSSLITTQILIQNYKTRTVNIHFKSICKFSRISCLFYDDKGRSLGSQLFYELILKAKSEVEFSFTTIRFF